MREGLAKRERQIVDAIYQLGEATASQIADLLPVQLANSTIRTQLRILEEKGVLKHRQVGKQYVYRGAIARGKAARSALQNVLETFFGGSVESALAMHLADPKTKLNAEQVQRLRELIDSHEQSEK